MDKKNGFGKFVENFIGEYEVMIFDIWKFVKRIYFQGSFKPAILANFFENFIQNNLWGHHLNQSISKNQRNNGIKMINF